MCGFESNSKNSDSTEKVFSGCFAGEVEGLIRRYWREVLLITGRSPGWNGFWCLFRGTGENARAAS